MCPGSPASPITAAAQYGNFIGGALVGPVDGKYREKPHARHGCAFMTRCLERIAAIV
jgi:hypothetical protein